MIARAVRALPVSAILAFVTFGSRTVAQETRPSGHGADSLSRFLAVARSSTVKYRDQRAAIADGYAIMGPDFPGMGEHWISMVRVFARDFDAAHPAVLEYATIDGHPTLVGVAYALPLLAGEEPPDFPSTEAWHGHHSTMEEEARVTGPMSESHGGMAGARLAMLHAWVWLDNPAGPWVADNWALPFARAGLAAPADVDASAGRAMSLATGSAGYFTALIEAGTGRSARDSAFIRGVVMGAARAVDAFRAGRASGPVTEAELERLRAIWSAMWAELLTGASSGARASIAPLAQELDR